MTDLVYLKQHRPYLVDCNYVVISGPNNFIRVIYISREMIDTWGWKVSVTREITNLRKRFGSIKEASDKDISRLNIINNDLVTKSISTWIEDNKLLANWGPAISDNHVEAISLIDILPDCYIESVCFECVRYRKERPRWFIEFIRKLENQLPPHL